MNIRVFNIKTKKANGIKMTGHRIVYKSVRSLACLEVANFIWDWSLACLEVANSLTPSCRQTSPLGDYAIYEIDHVQGVW